MPDPGEGKMDRGSREDFCQLNIFMWSSPFPQINLLVSMNRKVMYDLFFPFVSETIIELANDRTSWRKNRRH